MADYKSYWQWVDKTFIPTLMPRYWYGPYAANVKVVVREESTRVEVTREKNKKVKKTKTTASNLEAGLNVHGYEKGFVADHSTARLVGTARLRQLRIVKGVRTLFIYTGRSNSSKAGLNGAPYPKLNRNTKTH